MQQTAKTLTIILLILAVITVFGISSGPISSADFWWHLKSGQHIWETKSLPSTDPFSFTTEWDPIDPQMERNKGFTLKQAWLGQVIMYGMYRLFSFEGIIYLRAVLLTLVIILLYKIARREGLGLHASLFMTLPAVIIFAGFTPERPQLFSFLFFTLMVFLLEKFRRNSLQSRRPKPAATSRNSLSTGYYLLSTAFILLLWSNIHGGFFLGIILLFVYFSAELMKYITKSFGTPLPLNSLKALGLTAIVSSLASLANPNGYSVFIVLMERRHGVYRYLISETISTIDHMRMGLIGPELITFLFLLLLCLIFFLFHIKKMDLTDALTVIIFGASGIYLFRLIPFFVPLAVVFISRYRMIFSERFRTSRNDNHAKVTFPVSALLSLFLIFALVKGNLFGGIITTNLFQGSPAIVEHKYPEKAAKFLQDSGLRGNMFNPLDWGGYLMWSLYPNYKVFVDGRGLREDVVVNASKIMAAVKNEVHGMPEWKAYLAYYEVSLIITYSVDHFTGRLIPLIPALLNDPEWALIYADDISLIFAKDSPENSTIISKYALPKEYTWREVISEAQLKSGGFFSKDVRINFLITIGDAFLSLKEYQQAWDVYAQAWQLAPDNRMVGSRLQFLNSIFQ